MGVFRRQNKFILVPIHCFISVYSLNTYCVHSPVKSLQLCHFWITLWVERQQSLHNLTVNSLGFDLKNLSLVGKISVTGSVEMCCQSCQLPHSPPCRVVVEPCGPVGSRQVLIRAAAICFLHVSGVGAFQVLLLPVSCYCEISLPKIRKWGSWIRTWWVARMCKRCFRRYHWDEMTSKHFEIWLL